MKNIKQLNSRILLIVFMSSFCFSHVAHANDEEPRQSRSVEVHYEEGTIKQSTSRFSTIKNASQQLAENSLSQLPIEKNERKTRQQVIESRKLQWNKKSDYKKNPHGDYSATQDHSGDYLTFDIFDASSHLFSDEDYDGFYTNFSVTFDVDVFGSYRGQQAVVLADLYLSRNGGPWELYFTTEPFAIIDDSSEDEFEVLTILDQGYIRDHYDVLIDVYEYGYSDIIATVSADELESLYALPLESVDNDRFADVNSSTSVSIAAGSSSYLSICTLMLIALFRYKITH